MKPISNKLANIIFDPERTIRREQITIKAGILFDYLNLPDQGPVGFDRWMAELTGSRFHRPRPGDRLVKIDDDGDVSLAQPYAEMFLLRSSHTFGGALGLTLMIEACYLGSECAPEQIVPILSRFRPLARSDGFAPLSLLHEFLLIEEDITDWCYSLMPQHGMLTQHAPPRSDLHSDPANSIPSHEGPIVSPMMAAKIAVAHPGIRGRKMRACLISPKVTSIELDKNSTALLDELFSSPPNELSSLDTPHFPKAS